MLLTSKVARYTLIILLLTCAISLIGAHAFTSSKIHPSIKAASRSPHCRVWINFKDKSDAKQVSGRSSRAKQRQSRRSKNDRLDFTAFPVSKRYIEKVLALGVKHRITSRWLNAISIEASITQLDQIARFNFVKSIEPVIAYRRSDPVVLPYSAPDKYGQIRYGNSYKQLEQIKVNMLHEKNYYGENMLVGLLDTGFDLSHEAIIDTNVVGERDFIYDDENTANQPKQDDANQDEHGTFVLSVIAGNAEGDLIGVASSASYLIGKTEKVSENGNDFEKRIEEDWWIEGIEWMESMGVDVVNSSLGYSDWYRFSDLDGETAKITKAANLAVEKGVVVVIAAGNMGSSQSDGLGLQGHINPPADGFDVLAVGAVDLQGKVVGFSSRGPTYDGRIKPDLMALGMNVVVADAGSENAYIPMNGTSMASPLVAGVAVLLLQAFPNATARQIIEALRKTASLADSPDNDYGYGIVNAQAAYDFLLAGQVSVEVASSDTTLINSQWGAVKSNSFGFSLGQNYPNPFNPETSIPFTLAHATNVSIIIYDVQGRLIRQIELGDLPAGVYVGRDKAVRWNGVNRHGERSASGYYFYQLRAGDFTAVRKMMVVK